MEPLSPAFWDHLRGPAKTLLFLGLTGSGKSTVLQWLAQEHIATIQPTQGFNIKSIANIACKEVGGSAIAYWNHYIDGADALVYVVDVHDVAGADQSSQALQQVLTQLPATSRVLLVFNQKSTQSEQALSVAQLSMFAEVANSHTTRDVTLDACSCRGLEELVAWVLGHDSNVTHPGGVTLDLTTPGLNGSWPQDEIVASVIEADLVLSSAELRIIQVAWSSIANNSGLVDRSQIPSVVEKLLRGPAPQVQIDDLMAVVGAAEAVDFDWFMQHGMHMWWKDGIGATPFQQLPLSMVQHALSHLSAQPEQAALLNAMCALIL